MTTVRSSLARDVATVGTATLLSRLLGFVRDVGIAAVLGAGMTSDAFFAAMLIPNLFRRLLSEGALNAAFVPTWMRIGAHGGSDETQRFAEETFGAVLVGLGLLVLIATLLAPLLVHAVAPGFKIADQRFALAVSYLRIALPYVTIAGLVAVAAAVLNAQGCGSVRAAYL
jgi:putative peptidoglycan lipid II flippase